MAHGLGHGIGLEVHDRPHPWYGTGTFQTGDVFTIEPGIYVSRKLLEILPDTRQVGPHLDPEPVEVGAVADPRQHQQLRRFDRSGADNHLVPRPRGRDDSVVNELDADTARALEDETARRRGGYMAAAGLPLISPPGGMLGLAGLGASPLPGFAAAIAISARLANLPLPRSATSRRA